MSKIKVVYDKMVNCLSKIKVGHDTTRVDCLSKIKVGYDKKNG